MNGGGSRSVKAGINPVSFRIRLSNSPVIARVARGIYVKVGTAVEPGVVTQLQKEIKLRHKPSDYGWTPQGLLWCAIPVTHVLLSSGSVRVPPFVANFCEGEWSLDTRGIKRGEVLKCGNGYIWKLRHPLDVLGAEHGDACVLVFDVSKRTVSIKVGSEDLVDDFEDGCTFDTDDPEGPADSHVPL
jgi:hypothetical protein